MTPPHRITIGVPVFRGERLVGEALDSLLAQTFRDFKVVVSVDGTDEASAAICRPYKRDPRFRVVVQPDRLGWPDNLNRLMHDVDTEFFLFLAQDDRLEPECLAALIAHADRHRDAVIVYSDIRWFGDAQLIQNEPEIDGTTTERLLAQLERCTWLAHHGLQRNTVLRAAGPLVGSAFGGVLGDVVWVTKAMRHGPTRRVGLPLYLKRRHPGSVTALQRKWPPGQAVEAWLDVWAQMLAAVLPSLEDPDDTRRALLIVLNRVAISAPDLDWLIDLSRLDRERRRQILVQFLEFVRKQQAVDLPRLLCDGWRDILRWGVRETGLEPGLVGSLRREYRRVRRRLAG